LISAPTMRSLTTHHWPGNVRELRNMIEATLAMGEPPAIERVAAADSNDPFAPLLMQSYRTARHQLLQQFESRYLGDLLGGGRRSAPGSRDRRHLQPRAYRRA